MNQRLLKYMFVLWPWFFSSLMLAIFFQKNLFDFSPFWGDELVYWLSSNAFRAASWNAGYFGISEIQAPVGSSHWGLHGPLFPMLMQYLAMFFDWKPYSGVILNHIFLSVGFYFYWKTLKVDKKTKLMILFVLVTFWALIQFATCNMQESWHHLMGIALAIVVLRKVNKPETYIDLPAIIVFVLLTYSAFMRPAWSIVFLPILLVYAKTWKSVFAALICSLLMIILSPIVFQCLAAPMPNGGAQFIKFMTGSESIAGAIDYFVRNLKLFFDGDSTEQNQRLQIALLIIFCIGLLCFEKFTSKTMNILMPRTKAIIGITFTLVAYIVATLTMYIVGSQADYRVLSSPLLFSILVLFGLNIPFKLYIGGVLVFLNLMALPRFLQNFENFRRPNFGLSKDSVESFRSATSSFLRFNKNSNPWCHTIVSGGLDPWVYPEFQVLPAGFGVQGVWNWKNIKLPLKSKYLLLDQDIFETEKLKYLPRMQMASLNSGNLSIRIENIGNLVVKELTRVELLGRKIILFENLETICSNEH